MEFSPLEKKHLNQVHNWLQKEHVKKFYYGQGLENTLKNIDLYINGIRHNHDYSFDFWIASLSDHPFGLLMTSPIEGANDPYNKWASKDKETITLDLLIGEEEFLGKGLAHQMIKEFLKVKFPHVGTVLIDPAANNPKAIHVYEKAGFKKVKEFYPKFDPKTLHILMKLHQA